MPGPLWVKTGPDDPETRLPVHPEQRTLTARPVSKVPFPDKLPFDQAASMSSLGTAAHVAMN